MIVTSGVTFIRGCPMDLFSCYWFI